MLPKITRRKIDLPMVYGTNSYYSKLSEESKAIKKIITPSLDEALDLSGDLDPANQNHYSPEEFKGKIIHKYPEVVLAYVANACSAHCRYCYRSDLFNGSTGKSICSSKELEIYLNTHKEVKEVILSGGDPMVMNDRHLLQYLEACASVKIIRIATKEIVFRPQRFDRDFMFMLECFHAWHLDTHINFMFHVTHPDEFLDEGKWRPEVLVVIERLSELSFVSLTNQFPIIKGLNDSPDALRTIHEKLRFKGITTQYVFQCRNMPGYKHFAVPVETAFKLHQESQHGLSGLSRSKFVMSTEQGKVEVVGLTDKNTIFKFYRTPHLEDEGKLVVKTQRPDALWFDDYE